MNIIERLQNAEHYLELFFGAFSYPLVKAVVFVSVAAGVILFCFSRRDYDPNNRRYLLCALACPIIMVVAIGMGMWLYSGWLAEQTRWSSHSPTIDW